MTMPETFEGLVIEIGVRDLDLVEIQRFGIDGKAVVM